MSAIWTVQVNVTQEDIDMGMPGLSGECPIARAVSRAFPEYIIAVRDSYISVYEEVSRGAIMYARLPSEGVEFIRAFDRNRPVNPLLLTLEFKPWG